jgi:hypothetical protein
MRQKRTNRTRALLAIVAFLAFSSYSSNSFAVQKKEKQKEPPVAHAGQVIKVRKIDQLKEAFQRDAGKVRFVTILSPT